MFYSFSIIWPDRQEKGGEQLNPAETRRTVNAPWNTEDAEHLVSCLQVLHVPVQSLISHPNTKHTEDLLFINHKGFLCLFCRNWESLKLWGHSVISLLLNQRRIFFYFSPVMSHSGFGLVHFETVVFFPSKQTENTLWWLKKRKHTRDTLACRITPTDSTHTLTHTPNKGIPLKPHTHVVKFITRCLCVTFGFYPDPDVGK